MGPHRTRGLQQPQPTVKRHRAAEARRVRRSQHVHPRLHGRQGCRPHREEVEVNIISDEACSAQESDSVTASNPTECITDSSSYEGRISEEMLCAGAPGKDSCQGDSGGPFTVKSEETNQHDLVGVVSWGDGCAADGMFGVYAEVAKLRDWIDAKIEENGGATFCN